MHTHNDYFNANLLTFCMMTSKRGHFESEVADNFLNKTMAQLHGRQLDTHGTHMRKWANSAHLVKNRAEKWPLRPQKGPFESPEAFNYSAWGLNRPILWVTLASVGLRVDFFARFPDDLPTLFLTEVSSSGSSTPRDAKHERSKWRRVGPKNSLGSGRYCCNRQWVWPEFFLLISTCWMYALKNSSI